MTFDRQPDLVSAGPAFVAIMALVGAAFLLLFVWLIAYRGSTIAKWIFVGLNALGLLVLVDLRQILEREGATSVGIILIQSAAQLVALWMLFRRDARDWFAGRRPIDPAVFD